MFHFCVLEIKTKFYKKQLLKIKKVQKSEKSENSENGPKNIKIRSVNTIK